MQACINKTILFLKKQKVQYCLSICLFMFLFGFGYVHATKGIDLTDEGMYLSTSMRYSMGDIPFRDEIMNIMRPFDVLVSPLFMLYPDISLLQIRCLGLMLHSASLFALFLFLSRYGPPILVALLCAVMFLLNNFYGILSPSYNSLSSDFSLISMTSWLFAIASDKKPHRFLFAVIGGFLFSLAVLCYTSLVLVICIPLALAVIALCSFEKRNIYFQPSVIFVGTFGIIMSIVFISIASFGILPDFIQGFLEAKSMTRVGADGLLIKIHDLFKEFYYASPNGLILLGILLFALFLIIVPGKRKKNNLAYGILEIIAIIAVLFISPMILAKKANLVTLAFAVPLGLLVLFFKYKPHSRSAADLSWNRVRNVGIVWGFLSSLVYGMSSGMGLRACLLGATPLFVFGLVALYLFVDGFLSQNSSLSVWKKSWPCFLAVILPFLGAGLNFNYHYTYREVEVEALTTPFKNQKLAGIHSTPEKVRALEELLNYLNGKIEPKDYFLAYNYIPMLYFLTHTRPSYGAAWALEQLPVSIRERLVKKMLDEKKIPEYCIRMMAFPGVSWNKPNRLTSYSEDDPLNAFVMSNFYLEKIMYPFEIWHHGQGSKLRIFDQMAPVFKSSFLKWKGPDTINMRDLSKTAAPLMLQGYRGDFNFTRISNEDGNAIRVSPYRKGEKDELVVQFGYSLNKNGFDLKLSTGQEVIFIISARCSDRMMKKPPHLFIQDKTEKWERNSVIINKTTWDQYIVSKKIRNGGTDVCFGINWIPESEKEWLEIKHVRIFVAKQNK